MAGERRKLRSLIRLALPARPRVLRDQDLPLRGIAALKASLGAGWRSIALALLVLVGGVTAGIAYGGHGWSVLDALGSAGGLNVRYLKITGQKQTSDSAIIAALGIVPGSSILSIDVDQARARLTKLPWVREAAVRTLLPGVLQVSITERDAYARWEIDGDQKLIDRRGEVLSDEVSPAFASLPLVVGADANKRAVDIVQLVSEFPVIRQRMKAAVLIADRRWDILLDGDLTLRLPTVFASRALAALTDMQKRDRILDRAVTAIDMRLPDRVVLTLVKNNEPAPVAQSTKHPLIKRASL